MKKSSKLYKIQPQTSENICVIVIKELNFKRVILEMTNSKHSNKELNHYRKYLARYYMRTIFNYSFNIYRSLTKFSETITF